MKSSYKRSEIIGAILDAISAGAKTRSEIADGVSGKLLRTKKDKSLNGKFNTLRVEALVLLDELVRKKTVTLSPDDTYALREGKAMALRQQSCEEELLKLLSRESKNREQIKKALTLTFGTQKTASRRDDNMLSELITDTIKRLSRLGVIEYVGGKYRIPEKKSAMADNLIEIAGLRVSECTVSGGAADGGIDGIIRTVDSLGFRECIMVQTKNRNEHTSEIDVRGFWGAVCAAGGSRGIFVTTSSFHPVAEQFIKGIDNCVGIDGDAIFALAKELEYGICHTDDKIMIDTDVI